VEMIRLLISLSDSHKTELIGYFWSVASSGEANSYACITLSCQVSLYLLVIVSMTNGGQDQNDYFREMIAEVLAWGLQPKMVTGDAWYPAGKI